MCEKCQDQLPPNAPTLGPIPTSFDHSNHPRPMLKATSSAGLKRGKTPYKGVVGHDHLSNKLMVRQNSFNVRGRGAESINLGGRTSLDKMQEQNLMEVLWMLMIIVLGIMMILMDHLLNYIKEMVWILIMVSVRMNLLNVCCNFQNRSHHH